MDLLEIVGWAVFFYLMWQLIAAWATVQQIKHAVNDAVDAELARREVSKRIGVVRFEHVEQGPYSVVLIFDNETNKFLGQSDSETDAKHLLQVRYPQKQFVIVDDQDVVKSTINTVDAKPN